MLAFQLSGALASDSFSYSGRLVKADGGPVTGNVNLTFELAYSNQLGVVLCTKNLNGVSLANGVFHVRLDFTDCDLQDVLANTPTNTSVMIRVVDKTASPNKAYSYQAVHAVPLSIVSEVSKQLLQMGATTGQVLTWSGSQWIPGDPSDIQPGTVSGQVLQWNGTNWAPQLVVDNVGITTELDPTVQAFAKIPVPFCSNDKTLTFDSLLNDGAGGLYCESIVLTSTNVTEGANKYFTEQRARDASVENSLTLGVTDMAPSQDAVANALDLKQDSITSITELEMKSVKLINADNTWIGLSAPTGSQNFFFTLPASKGTTGQYLKTDGNGNLIWGTASVDSANIEAGSINDSHISSLSTSVITGLDGTLTALSNSITNLTTDQVSEGSRLYFTQDKVLSTPLTGFVSANGVISDTDTVVQAFGKMAGNIEQVKGDYLKIDGTMAMSGNLNLDTNKIVNVIDPTDDQDVATKKYVDDHSYWLKSGADISYLSGNVSVGSKLRLRSNTGSFLELKAADGMATDRLYIFPATDVGANGYALTTNGSGVLSWSPVATTATTLGGHLTGTIANAEISDGVVTYNKLALSDGEIPQVKVNNLVSDLAGKEPVINQDASPAGKYWDGNKTWKTLDTDAVAEGSNEYFTEARVKGTILTGYIDGAPTPVLFTDTLLQALGKLQGQITANDNDIATLNSKGQWLKTGTAVHYNGPVGIGTDMPLRQLHGTGGAYFGTDTGFPTGYAGVENEFFHGVLYRNTESNSSATVPYVGTGSYLMHAPAASGTARGFARVAIAFSDIVSGVTNTGQMTGDYVMSMRNHYVPNSDNGTLSNLFGKSLYYGHDGAVPTNSPKTTSVVGLFLAPSAITGEISNLTDLYIREPGAGGTLTDHWAIYQEAVGAKNYFAGQVGVGTNTPIAALHVSRDDGLDAGEHWVLRADHPTLGGIVLGYEADGTNYVSSKVRSASSTPLVLGTSNNKNALTINDNKTANYLGRPITRYNPNMSLQLGDHDWTDMIGELTPGGSWVYSSADRGIKTTGITWFTIKVRMPIDPKGVYRATVRVKKIDGTGTFYVGANSYDGDFNELRTDGSNMYNYFAASNHNVPAGTTYVASGTISGHNLPADTNRNRFDPGAKYFDLVIITNHAGTGTSVIESVEVYKEPTQEPWKTANYTNGWSNYGSGYSPPGYYKDTNGIVHLRGLVKGGTIGAGSCIFYLDEGYRPDYIRLLHAQTYPNDVMSRINISPDGCVNPATGNNLWISLDGLSFRAL